MTDDTILSTGRRCPPPLRAAQALAVSAAMVVMTVALAACVQPVLRPDPIDLASAPPDEIAPDRPFPRPPALADANGQPRALALRDLLILAEHGNRDLLAARQSIPIAEASYAEAFAGRMPRVTISGQVRGREPTPSIQVPGFGAFPTEDRTQVAGNLNITVPVFSFGRVETAEGLAQIGIERARNRVRIARQQMRAQVIDAYFALQLARADETIAAQRVKLLEQQDRDVANLLSAGLATESELLTVEARLNLDRVAHGRAQLTVREQTWRLLTLLGLQLDTAIAFADTRAMATIDLDPADAARFAVEQRPETVDAVLTINEANVAAAAAGAERLPTIAFQYDLTAVHSELTTHEFVHSGAVTLTWPVFQGGAVEARVQRARQQMLVATTRFHQTVEAIVLDVTLYYAQWRFADESLAAFADAVDAAERALSVRLEQQQAGLADAFDVLEAETLVAEAQQQWAGAQLDRDRAVLRFRLALGLGADIDVTALFADPTIATETNENER